MAYAGQLFSNREQLYDVISEQMRDQDFATVPVGELFDSHYLEEAVRHLTPLVSELSEMPGKEQFHTLLYNNVNGSSIGYEEADRTDPKVYIYFRPELEAYWKQIGLLDQSQHAVKFIEAAARVYEGCMQLRQHVVDAFSLKFPGLYKGFQGGADVLKFMVYPPHGPCGQHADPSPVTFHLLERPPGFYVVRDGEHKYASPNADEALILLGATFPGLIQSYESQDKAFLTPTLHGADSDTNGRIAVAFFNRDGETFGRIPEEDSR